MEEAISFKRPENSIGLQLRAGSFPNALPNEKLWP